jgi:hypothetical protein
MFVTATQQDVVFRVLDPIQDACCDWMPVSESGLVQLIAVFKHLPNRRVGRCSVLGDVLRASFDLASVLLFPRRHSDDAH